METMTPKERIDAVIKHQAVDRTPFTVVDGGAWIAKTEGVTYRELYSRPDSGASSVVDYLNKIDSDMISAVSGVFTACLNAFGCPISIDKIGGAIDTGSVFKDPINEIPQLNRETIRDTLLANDFVQKMINQTRHVKVLVGNQKYIFGDIAGPFTMAAVMVGTSDFIMLMLEEPEIVHELLDFTVCVSAEMFTLLHENGCDIAFPAEPVGSGSLISQEMFEEWVIPSLKKLKEKLPFYKYFYAHVCGASGNRVAALRECGVNVFSVDYLVDFEKAVEAAGEKMVMMGNINPAGILNRYINDEEYGRRYVEYHSTKKSKRQIQYELQRKGLSKEAVTDILEEHPVDEEAQIRDYIRRKRLEPEAMTLEERRKAMAALGRKGFSFETVNRVFGSKYGDDGAF